MRLSRVLCAFLICTTLLMACASPKTPGIHRRDRDSWPDTGTVRLADGLLPCAGATVLLVTAVAVVVGIGAARRHR